VNQYTALFSLLLNSIRTLKVVLVQQSATGEVLRVISSRPGVLQPVLDTIAASAVCLCGADLVAVFQRQGDVLVRAGDYGMDEASRAAVDEHPVPVSGTSTATARAIAEQRPVQIDDVLADPGYHYAPQSVVRYRTVLAVPL